MTDSVNDGSGSGLQRAEHILRAEVLRVVAASPPLSEDQLVALRELVRAIPRSARPPRSSRRSAARVA